MNVVATVTTTRSSNAGLPWPGRLSKPLRKWNASAARKHPTSPFRRAYAPAGASGCVWSETQHRHHAWVSYLSGPSPQVVRNIIIQVASVKRHSCVKAHVTLITPDVDAAHTRALEARGSRIVRVGPVPRPRGWGDAGAEWASVQDVKVDASITLIKYHAFGFNGDGAYKTTALLDSDAFLVSPDADRIFRACRCSVCAVRDGYETEAGLMMANTGVIAACELLRSRALLRVMAGPNSGHS